MRLAVFLCLFAFRAQAQTFIDSCIRPADLSCPAAQPGMLVNASLKSLLATAFEVEEDRVEGPSWLATERFEMIGKASAGATREEMLAMLRNVLTNRFGVVVRREQKAVDGYLLVVGKSGVKLNPAGSRPGVNCPDCTMADFAEYVSRQVHKPVEDGTGLPGRFDIRLNFGSVSDRARPVVSAAIPNPPVDRTRIRDSDIALENHDITLWPAHPAGGGEHGPSFSSALEKQLGLKLEKRKVQAEVVIVEHIEKSPR